MTVQLPEIINPSGEVAVAIPTFSFTRLPQLEKCVTRVLANLLSPDVVVIVVDNNPALADTLQRPMARSCDHGSGERWPWCLRGA